MEKEFKLKTKDGKYIFGRIRGSLEKPLVIFVHGLTGHVGEHIFHSGARFFEKNGFSALLWNQYSWQDGARNLSEVTLAQQAEDLDSVVKFARKKGAKKIFVVGHSYGGATVLLSKEQDFDGAVLWDSTYAPIDLLSEIKHDKKKGIYYVPWGMNIIFGKQMVNEMRNTKSLSVEVENFKKPIKVIVAGKNDLIKGWKKLYETIKVPKDFAIIKNANHTFDEEGTEEALFDETSKWLKKLKH
ncbi:MAG: Alpha/beta hydrolase [Candidatus Moranbacteria bacterium GW2011_GWD2_36_12]|nr:MAG: Alpha/beta hydrolase [Candidatus Moranbacteria bacterium GW2011_GWD2_36_12]KKQ04891.1 MAG: Alpha/beta hydrolase [Candidatus Moranbacteria bacterium GW2011_GWE2_36_40]